MFINSIHNTNKATYGHSALTLYLWHNLLCTIVFIASFVISNIMAQLCMRDTKNDSRMFCMQ